MQKTHKIWSEKKREREREITLVVFDWHDFNAR